MKTRLFLLVVLLLSGCAGQRPSTIITRADGPTTAAALTSSYHERPANCGSDTMPAFLCSGVMIRVTTYGDAYESWDPSDKALAKGSVSCSFLRKDNNFARFAWDRPNVNGLIFYPVLDTPAGLERIQVLCFFPMDGWTDGRTTDQGCGAYPGVANTDKCHRLNITMAEQWNAAYPPGTGGYAICGWDVRDELNQYAGPNFYQGMRSKWRDSGYFSEWNELLLKVWDRNLDGRLPLQAFFYNNSTALIDAKKDRAKFLSKTGISIPLIKVTLPTTPTGDATFQYIAGDQ